MFFLRKSVTMPSAADALPGRDTPIQTAIDHFVLGTPIKGPYPEGAKQVIFGLGCFWGAERVFWKMDGVFTTAVGYAAGHTPNPSYEEVCSGQTGHNEVVLVVYEPEKVSLEALLSTFWESHDPTQGMRQGNDVGTQYRSGIYLDDRADIAQAEASRKAYQSRLNDAGYGTITTEIQPAPTVYFAEAYHQQYLAKNPGGYCGLGGTGVTCPTGVLDAAS
ncbi:peptide-methionine (S)-S-oxide reductase MsrA [Tepidamorphus sp. 3E244]|uniref:peptide-methionine (S)-S-oxide reductase MsrA n=1 Tax=Tepidamorphus sp. 3E244 TaxID=3385498 RepID=UPI0038FC825E